MPKQSPADVLVAHLPPLWIGYASALLAIVAQLLSRSAQAQLESFVFYGALSSWYVMYCVYRYHEIVGAASEWRHPINPVEAVLCHFIAFYQFYFVFKWTRAMAAFVNARTPEDTMSGRKSGLLLLVGLVAMLAVPGIGGLLMSAGCGYVSTHLRRALVPGAQPATAMA